MRHRLRVRAALLAVLGAALLAPAALASGGALPGRIYDGARISGAQNISLAFLVSGNGRVVRRLTVTYLDLTCQNRDDATLTTPVASATAISATGSFRVALPTRSGIFENGATSNPVDGRLTLTGRFGAGGALTGALTFTGIRDARGCRVRTTYAGRVRPFVDRYSGTVTQGSAQTPITFLRTAAARPQAGEFAVGPLTLACPGGGTSDRSFVSVDALRIHPSGAFGGDVSLTDGEEGSISGVFSSATQATGTISYTGRDDCSYSDLPWSVQRVATHVLGPLTFG